jgi:hypothetical protein
MLDLHVIDHDAAANVRVAHRATPIVQSSKQCVSQQVRVSVHLVADHPVFLVQPDREDPKALEKLVDKFGLQFLSA